MKDQKKELQDVLDTLKHAQRFIQRVDDLHQTIYWSGLDEACQEAVAKLMAYLANHYEENTKSEPDPLLKGTTGFSSF